MYNTDLHSCVRAIVNGVVRVVAPDRGETDAWLVRADDTRRVRHVVSDD